MKRYCRHPDLPKANLISVRRSYVDRWFWKGHTVRVANAREFFWLGLNITVRRPWLEHSARSLYPKLFAQGAAHD